MTTRTDLPQAVERRPLRRHHIVALALSAGLSAIALFDAGTKVVTGHFSVFADDSGNEPVILAGSLVHGAAYLALLYCLHQERHLFARASRLLQVVRIALTMAFALFGVSALVMTPVQYLLTGRASFTEEGTAGIVSGIVATVAFVLMLLGGTIAGLTQVRRATLGAGGRILALMAPVFVVTVLLGFLAPDWSHPGYLEATLNLGISLVGVGAVVRPARRPAS